MMLRRPIVLAIWALLMAAVGYVFIPHAAAQGDDFLAYFPETGHAVREPFIQFFNRVGGVNSLGFPITDDYVDSETGLLVQYFQKARLEWHPGNPDPYKVQLGLLGDELGKRTPPIPVRQIPSPSDPSCQYFPETGHSACFKFLDHWRTQGGLDLYGYPITEYLIENDRIVQYFQRARMEWYPEKPEGYRVQLASLGHIYYDFAGLDRERLTGRPVSGYYKPVALKARAAVLDPVLAAGSQQTGFVHVADQLGNPIANAAVTLVVRGPNAERTFNLNPTNANGVSTFSFPVETAKAGAVVEMEFTLTYGGIIQTTRTSYMVWYY